MMAGEEPSTIVALSIRLYRLLLALYPRAHRREYGALMLQNFRDLARDAYSAGGTPAVLGLWCHTLVDLGATAAGEHLDELKRGGWFAMWRHALGRALLYALTYVGLLLPSFVTVALAWHWLVEDVLYYHWDRAPIGDFFPPFIDPRVPNDRYVVSESAVYLVWCAFLAAVFLAPALAIWLNRKRWLHARPAATSVAGVARSLLPALLAVGMIWVGISLFWDRNGMLASGIGSIPGLMALLRGHGQAICIVWLTLSAIVAVTRAGEGRHLPAWGPVGLGALLALTIGGPLYCLLGLPALAAALISLLAWPRTEERIPWPLWLGIGAVAGVLVAPLPRMDLFWALAETGLALLTASGALYLGRRFGRRAGLPVLAAGFLPWLLGIDRAYGTPIAYGTTIYLPDTVLIPFAVLLLVALPVWLLRILPPTGPAEPQPLQEAPDA